MSEYISLLQHYTIKCLNDRCVVLCSSWYHYYTVQYVESITTISMASELYTSSEVVK